MVGLLGGSLRARPDAAQELGFVHHLDAKGLGLLQLAPCLGACHHEAGLLAHRTGYPPAGPLDQRGGLGARQRREGAGQDEGFAGEGVVSDFFGGLGGVEAEGKKAVDFGAVFRGVEVGDDRGGRFVADPVDGKKVGTAAELTATLDDYKVGDQVKLLVWREGRKVDLTAQLLAGDEA